MEQSIAGIHHVTAIATDPQKNLDFYSGVLGLRLVKKTVNFDDPGTYHLYYGDEEGRPGTIMTFFPWQGAPRGSLGAGMGWPFLVANLAAFAIFSACGGAGALAVEEDANAGGVEQLAITTTEVPAAFWNQSYTFALRAEGGHRDYVWTLEPSARLPAGLTLDPAGTLRGRTSSGTCARCFRTLRSSCPATARRAPPPRTCSPPSPTAGTRCAGR